MQENFVLRGKCEKCCILGAFLVSVYGKASEPITIVAPENNLYPPFYIIGAQSGKPWQGIWPGVVQGTVESFKIQVQWEVLNTAKFEEMVAKAEKIRQGYLLTYKKVACTVDSPQWMGEGASSFYLSDTVVELKDFMIYQKKDFKTPPKLEDLPQGEKIAVC